MKFLLMIHGAEDTWEPLSEPEQEAARHHYRAFASAARERGALLRGGELQPTTSATTVRVADGQTLVTDGPYAETREALGGFMVLEAATIDEVVELAKQLPEPPDGGGIEIRPVYQGEGPE
jgi:hypothetical protein